VAQHKSDIEIAREATLKPIGEIGAGLDIPHEALLPYGHTKAKLSYEFLDGLTARDNGKLILVTAMTPTPAGEGKTTTSVGLADGLNRIGKKTIVCLREPSLGPCFGMKGGAAGGGYAQVVPMEDINLHFTGDFHAIGAANNLLAAMLDNHIHWGNALGIDARRVFWRRVVDMNDRALRNVTCSLGGIGNGFPREDGFDITVASEVMAIFCLADNMADLERRLGNIVVAQTRDRKPITAKQLDADGAMTVLLKDAFMPNLVQTLENNPATVRALKMHGGVGKDDLGLENLAAVTAGCSNLARHIRNVKSFGVPVVVAVNRFVADTDAEVEALQTAVKEQGATAIMCTHWADGGAGTQELAEHVVAMIDKGESDFSLLYPDEMPLWEKVETIATKLYGADGIEAPAAVRNRFKQLQDTGFGHFPVCMAKTQYSFSTDLNLKGAPTGHTITIRELRLSAGAEFVVAVCGDVMTMPGLPRVPAAASIRLNDAGEVEGLF
jgi:formate--tetrahydrofolate ligase